MARKLRYCRSSGLSLAWSWHSSRRPHLPSLARVVALTISAFLSPSTVHIPAPRRFRLFMFCVVMVTIELSFRLLLLFELLLLSLLLLLLLELLIMLMRSWAVRITLRPFKHINSIYTFISRAIKLLLRPKKGIQNI